MTASRRPADTQSLRHLIDRQIDCANTLLDTLERERQALLGQSLPALEQACSEKQAAATTLQSLNLEMMRIGSNARAIEALIESADPSDPLRERWSELLGLAARCQRANLGNGALLDERQSQLRRDARLPAPPPGAVYGRSGSSAAGALSQRLASA